MNNLITTEQKKRMKWRHVVGNARQSGAKLHSSLHMKRHLKVITLFNRTTKTNP